MGSRDLLDRSVAELMSAYPSTIRVFIARGMHCVGCPISPFHTLSDAAEEHGLLLAGLVEDVEREVVRGGLKDAQASARRQSAGGGGHP